MSQSSPLPTGTCENPACRALFQRKSRRKRYCSDKCRFDHWRTYNQRAYVRRKIAEEEITPTLWHAVFRNVEEYPLALFRNYSEAADYAKTHCKGRHLISRVELSLPNPRQKGVIASLGYARNPSKQSG